MTSRQPNSPAAADGVGPGGQRPSSLPGGGRRSRSGPPRRRADGGGQENRHGLSAFVSERVSKWLTRLDSLDSDEMCFPEKGLE